MFEVIIFDVLFFAIPSVLILLFGISMYRYLSAKKQNKKVPGTFSPEEIQKRKIIFIILSVVTGIFLAVVIGFIALLFMAVAFM